jgi:hypothetical protein
MAENVFRAFSILEKIAVTADRAALLNALLVDTKEVPVTGKTEVKPAASPAPGFGLKAKKTEEKKESGQQTLSAATTLDPVSLGVQLTEWFAKGFDHLQQFGETGVHLALFELQSKVNPKRTFPLLGVPVEVVPQPARGVFHIRHSDLDVFFYEEAGKLFQQAKAILPLLPDLSSDISPEKLLRDLEDQGVGLGEYTLLPSMHLVLAKAVQTIPDETWTSTVPGPEFRQINEPLSELYPSQREAVATAIQNASLIQAGDVALRASIAVQSSLASVLDDAPVLVIADDNRLLSFVEKKLDQHGAHPFVFPLYRSADRYRFRQLVTAGIDRSQPPGTPDPGAPLPLVARFFESLLKKKTSFDRSPAELARFILERESLASVPLAVPNIMSWTPEQLETMKARLRDYQAKTESAGNDLDLFWKQVHAPELNQQVVTHVRELAGTALTALRDTISRVQTAAAKTGLETPQTLSEIALFEKRLDELEKAPVLPKTVFHHEWSPLPEKVKELLNLVAQAKEKNSSISEMFHPQILDEHLEELLPRLQAQSLSPMRFINSRYRKELNRLKAYTHNPESITKLEPFWERLHQVRGLQKLLQRIGNTKDTGERLFGKEWQGVHSDAQSLLEKAHWLEHFERRRMRRFFTSEELMKQFLSSNDRTILDRLAFRNDIYELEDAVRHIIFQFLLDKNHELHRIRLLPFQELEFQLATFLAGLDSFETWKTQQADQEVYGVPPLSEFLALMRDRTDIEPARYPDVFEKSFYSELLQRMLALDPELQEFTFRHLKEISDALNAETDRQKQHGLFLISRQLDVLRMRRMQALEAEPAFSFVQHELKKSTRFISQASFLQRAGSVLVLNAPLWLVRSGQIELIKEHLPRFRTIITLDIATKNRDDLRERFSNFTQIHISATAAAPKGLPGLGFKAGPKQPAASLIPSLTLADPWKEPLYETISTNPYGSARIPFEVFEVLHDNRLTGRTSVIFQDEAALQEFWNQCATLYAKDETIRAWYWQTQGTKTFRFASALTDAETAADHAIVIMKKAVAATKPTLGFGIKTTTASTAAITFPREVLARIPGHILLLGETGTDAAPYVEPVKPERKNRFTTLIKSLSADSTMWKIKAGHHDWEASIKHAETGRSFYILADLPDPASASLADRFDFTARYFDSAIAFSALAALRDRETAVNRVFELAEERIGLLPVTFRQETTAPAVPDTQPEITAGTVQDDPVPDDFQSKLREAEPAKVPNWERVTSKQEIQQPDPALLPKFEPYPLYHGVLMGDRQEFFEAPERRIQKLIGEIVDLESPVHYSYLYRTVVGFWQIQRLDNHVQSVFNRQLSEMLKKKRVFLSEGCLYATEDLRLKPRNRSAILDYTLADEIPLDEIQAAIFRVLEKIAPLEPADLIESVSWCLGLPPGFKGFEKRFERALALMSDARHTAYFRTAVMLHPDIDPRRKSVGL